jgi:hypothetical protein
LLYLRGGGCSSAAECGSGFCTDGVCCEAASCGTCETCAGTSPGTCTPVTVREDPDTCATKDKLGCDSIGRCGRGLGAACTLPSDCFNGICADGVCCDTKCDGACQACAAKLKLTKSEDGRCGPIAVGENPRNLCEGAAKCDGTGACKVTVAATCKSDTIALGGDGTEVNCGDYKCKLGVCPAICANVDDCNAPASCTRAGKCVTTITAPGASGCCATVPSGTSTRTHAALGACALAALVVALRRRKQRGN